MVCKEDWEMRHPSDFLRVQKEKIAVAFSRPYPATDTFVPDPMNPVNDETDLTWNGSGMNFVGIN